MATNRATASGDPFGLIGRTLDGRYRLDGFLGDGGFSVVYRAYDQRIESHVALKVLKTPMATADGDEAKRLAQREFASLFDLAKYPISVVRATDLGVIRLAQGTWASYIVMELLVGATLDEILSDERQRGTLRPLSPAEVVTLLKTAADALATAHDIGIAHCDVKPSNLFLLDLPDRCVVKVLDFGIAKKVGTDGRTKTTVVGAYTQEYAAPEQFDPGAFGKTGPHTDVFAFALVAIELMTAAPALDGETPAHFLYSAVRLDRRPTPRTKGLKHVADDLEAVFAKALAVDPRDRYHTMGEFWTDLTRAAGPAPASIRWPSKPITRPPPPPPPPHRDRSKPTAVAGAALLGVVALAGWYLSTPRVGSGKPENVTLGPVASAAAPGSARPAPVDDSAKVPAAPSSTATSTASLPTAVASSPPLRHDHDSPPFTRGTAWDPMTDGPAPPPPPNGHAYGDDDCQFIKTKWKFPLSHRFTNCRETWSTAQFRSREDCDVFKRCFP